MADVLEGILGQEFPPFGAVKHEPRVLETLVDPGGPQTVADHALAVFLGFFGRHLGDREGGAEEVGQAVNDLLPGADARHHQPLVELGRKFRQPSCQVTAVGLPGREIAHQSLDAAMPRFGGLHRHLAEPNAFPAAVGYYDLDAERAVGVSDV